METETNRHLLLIDGMALLFRSFFATSAMGHYFPNEKGIATNGIQGFARHTMTAQTIFKPTDMAVCWDMGAQTFRNDIFEGYKANRPEPPAELVPQFDMTRELSSIIGWKNFGVPQVEADDLIGSLVEAWDGEAKITVVTGDKDMLQLLRPNVEIALVKKGYREYNTYTEARFIEEYGITPKQFIDKKAFTGDASDGYPGVKGIGPKTAIALIQKYGSVDGVLAALDELTPARRKRIEEDLEMLHISRELAEIDCHIALDNPKENFQLPLLNDQLIHQMNDLGYRMIAKHIQTL